MIPSSYPSSYTSTAATHVPVSSTNTVRDTNPLLSERVNATFLEILSTKITNLKQQVSSGNNTYPQEQVINSVQEVLNLIHAEYSSNLINSLSAKVISLERQLSSGKCGYYEEEVQKAVYEILDLVHAEYSIETSPDGNKQIKFVFPSPDALNSAKKAFEEVIKYDVKWKDWQFSKDSHSIILSSNQTYCLLGFPRGYNSVWDARFTALMSKIEANIAASKTSQKTDSAPQVIFSSPVLISLLKTPEERLKEMEAVFNIYYPGYAPTANRNCLSSYIQTPDFERHAATAKAYYNKHQLSLQDAAQVAFQREPVNIAMGQHYNKENLASFISSKGFSPHTESAFNNSGLKKSDGTSFTDQPCTVSIYSETYLWSQPGAEASKKEICCLSVPAPALDSSSQPHYAYYMTGGSLDQEKYSNEMEVLANMVVTTAIENKNSAFQGKGIKRLVIPLYGQGAFLASLDYDDRSAATKLFYANLVAEIKKHAKNLEGLEIVMSEYGSGRNDEMQSSFVEPLKDTGLKVGIINGDILRTAKEGDMIVNAWDPHSAPGNGNDADRSFDGAMGKGTAIGLTQLAWINPYISKKSDGMPVDASRYVGLPQ